MLPSPRVPDVIHGLDIRPQNFSGSAVVHPYAAFQMWSHVAPRSPHCYIICTILTCAKGFPLEMK